MRKLSSITFTNKEATSPSLASPNSVTQQDEHAQTLLDTNEKVTLLCEVIGGSNLSLDEIDDSINDGDIQPYCIIRFGSKIIHQTKKAREGGRDPIWTVSTASLFLLTVTPNDIASNNKLLVSVWYKQKDPLQLTTLKTLFLGKAVFDFSSMILPNLDEQRIDADLLDEYDNHPSSRGYLTCRFRLCVPSDRKFFTSLESQPIEQLTRGVGGSLGKQESSRFLQLKDNYIETSLWGKTKKKEKNLLITETSETEQVGLSFFNAIASAFQSKSKRDDRTGETKFRVKPNPDPSREKETTYMTKQELVEETLAPSKEWIEAGSGKLGKLYLEILSCHDLPNLDVGEAAGNLTDCFICAVFEDAVAQTNVIDDELSPLWMPWTQRAFVFGVMHPASFLYLAAFDFDVGSQHEPIGRVAVNLSHFQPRTDYTLKYNLYPSSNVTDRIAAGSIKIRLRIDYHNQKEALLLALRPPPKFHVNVRKEKTLTVVRYTCFGEYGDDQEQPFDLTVTRSYVNEILEYKAALSYCVGDAFRSLVLWRGQVIVFKTLIPLHSFLFFCMATMLVERPHLTPPCFLITVGWILLAAQTQRRQHPSPWSRCHSFWYYLEILIKGQSSHEFTFIKAGQGARAAKKYENQISERLQRDEKEAEHQAALQQKILEMGDENIHTKVPMGIPLDVFIRLTRYQGIIGRVCQKFRAIKLILTWEDSITSFWITVCFLSGGLISLILPWRFILIWVSRIFIWGLFGPHMKIVDWILFSKSHDDEAVLEKMMEKFKHESRSARIRRQEALKLQDMKCLAFGDFITRVPLGNLSRYYDYPLPESYAKIVRKKREVSLAPYCIPGQQYFGIILPRTEKETDVFEQEVLQAQSLKTSFVRTVKHLQDSKNNESMKRMKSSKLDEELPDSVGYELISYDPTSNSTDDRLTRLFLGKSSWLSLNLLSSRVAILHSEDNEGSMRRRSSTFRGGFELLPVTQGTIEEEEDEDKSDDNDKGTTCTSKEEGVSLHLGSSKQLVLNSKLRLAIVDTQLQEELNRPTHMSTLKTTKVPKEPFNDAPTIIRISEQPKDPTEFNDRPCFVSFSTRLTRQQEELHERRHRDSMSNSSIPVRSKEKVDPLQCLAKRSVESIIRDVDEERESGDVEIVLCSTRDAASIHLDADYNNDDGDMQSVLGGFQAGEEDSISSRSTMQNPSILYFRPSIYRSS